MTVHFARRTVFTFGFSLAAVLLFSGAKDAKRQIQVRNSVRNTVTLWVWDFERSNWRRPPIRVNRGAVGYLNLPSDGKVYLVARDSEGRDFRLGWYRFHELLRQVPDGELELDLSRCIDAPAPRPIDAPAEKTRYEDFAIEGYWRSRYYLPVPVPAVRRSR